MSSDPPPTRLSRPGRFHELIEEVIAEYERVCAQVGGHCPPLLGQKQRPAELEDAEACKLPQVQQQNRPKLGGRSGTLPQLEAEPPSEISLPGLRQGREDSSEDGSLRSLPPSMEPMPLMELPGQLMTPTCPGQLMPATCPGRMSATSSNNSEDRLTTVHFALPQEVKGNRPKSKFGDVMEEDRSELICKIWWKFMCEYMGRHGATIQFTVRKCWSNDTDGRRTRTTRGSTDVPRHHEGDGEDRDDPVRRVWHEERARGRRAAVHASVVHGVALGLSGDTASTGWMIHPCSTWRLLWVLMSLVFLAVDVTFMTMFMFEIVRNESFDAVDCIYWTADVLINFRTGLYRKVTGLDMNPRSVAKSYLKTWAGLDLFLVVFQWAVWFLDDGKSMRSAAMIRYMRIVRCLKLLRLMKLNRMASFLLERIQSLAAHLVMKMAIYMLCVVIWVHVSACTWYWVGKDEGGWVEKFKSQNEEYGRMPLNYFVAAYWAVTQLQGNSNVDPGLSSLSYAFALGQVLASIVVLAGLISRLTTVMQTLEKSTAQRRRLMDSARSYCISHEITRDLFLRVRKYIERQQVVQDKQFHNKNELELLQVLPKNLCRELLLEARAPLLNHHLFFTTIGRFCKRFYERLCCDLLHAVVHLPGESIYTQGVVAKYAYFVAAGDTSLFTYGFVYQALNSGKLRRSTDENVQLLFDRQKELNTEFLQEGTAVCEASLWVRWVHCGDFDAVSQASLLTIEVLTFEELVKSYVSVQEAMLGHAMRIAKALNEMPAWSDLFTSVTALQVEEASFLARTSVNEDVTKVASRKESFTAITPQSPVSRSFKSKSMFF